VLSRVHAAYVAAKECAERAEAALEVAEAALAQERDGAEAYKVAGEGKCCHQLELMHGPAMCS